MTRGTGVMYQNSTSTPQGRDAVAQRQVQIAHPGQAGVRALSRRNAARSSHGDPVYPGQIIGVNNKGADLVVNAIKEKKLTNMRSSGADDAIQLIPPREMTLEFALEFIDDDELVEVTPKSIRLRKKILNDQERKVASKKPATV
jgi:GTP-binding protein